MKILTNSQGKPLMNQQGKVYEAPVIPVEAEENDVNFYDYDGFRVASFTIAEAKALTQAEYNAILPPTHEGLTFQEWNWTWNDITTYNRKYIDIGANYRTVDGKTHIKVQTDADGTVDIGVLTKKNNVVLVEWGDGNTEEISNSSSSGSTVTKTHIYASPGIYDIKLSLKSGDFYHPRCERYSTRNIIELNCGDDSNGIYLSYCGWCLITTSKYNNYFYFRNSKTPQTTIPRNAGGMIDSYAFSCNSKYCFPKYVQNFSGASVVSSSYSTLVVPEFSDVNASQSPNLFSSCTYVTKLSISNTLNFSSVPSASQGFVSFTNLYEIDIVQGWTPNVNLMFSGSRNYTRDTLIDFFNKLGTTTNAITLTFSSDNLNKLTAEEKAIATNKGYTLA